MILPDFTFPIITKTTKPKPSRTYRLDPNTGNIRGIIDGKKALEQFIRKALNTERFRYLIYSNNYGSELNDLISNNQGEDFIFHEAFRMVREALIDDRIYNIDSFEVIITDENTQIIKFRANTSEGNLIIEEVISSV